MGWRCTKYTSTTTITAPSEVMYVTGCAGGAGGGGGDPTPGGGGGGGCSGQPVDRYPIFCVVGETLTLTIGSYGAGGSAGNNGSNGGNTTISGSTSGSLLVLYAGYGGSKGNGTAGGAAGSWVGGSGLSGAAGGANGVAGSNGGTNSFSGGTYQLPFPGVMAKQTFGGGGGGLGANGGSCTSAKNGNVGYLAGGTGGALGGGGGSGGCTPWGKWGAGGSNGGAGTAPPAGEYGAGGGGGSGNSAGGDGSAGVLWLMWYEDVWSASNERTALGLASANLDTQLSTLGSYIDTEVAAIKSKTDNLPADTNTLLTSTGIKVATNADKTGYALATTPPTAVQIRTEIDANSTKLDSTVSSVLSAIAALHDFDPATDTVAHVTLVDTTTTLTNTPDVPTESETATAVLAGFIESGFTLKQAIRLILSAQAGKLSGANGTTISIRDINDAKNRIVATVDKYGNRSSLIYDTSD